MANSPRFGPCLSSFRDAPLGAGPESILIIVVMDSGLALRAPRNDGHWVQPKPLTNAKLRPLVPEQPQPPIVNALLLRVADAIDRAGPVVGNQYRTVLGQDDIGGT